MSSLLFSFWSVSPTTDLKKDIHTNSDLLLYYVVHFQHGSSTSTTCLIQPQCQRLYEFNLSFKKLPYENQLQYQREFFNVQQLSAPAMNSHHEMSLTFISVKMCHFKQIIATALLMTCDAFLLIWTTCLSSLCYLQPRSREWTMEWYTTQSK